MAGRNSVITGVVLAAVTSFQGSLHAQTAATKTLQFQSINTTSFGSAPFNFNGDGVANYAWYSGRSEMGRITGQGVSQSAPTGKSCTLPNGKTGIELKLVDHVAVTRFEDTGDLLYERGKPGDLVACLNLQDGSFHEEGTVDITGGTGAFLGARGSYTAKQDGQVLVPPGSDKLQFGFANATYTYKLTVPQNGTPTLAPQAQTIAVAQPKNLVATSPSVQLDASASSSSDGKPLTYLWSLVPSSPAASIINPTSAMPSVQFSQPAKTYTFLLTVTDSAGRSATDFAVVNYIGN